MTERMDAKIISTGPSPRGWHRLQQAAECLQKYALGYEDPEPKVEGSPSPPLAKGSLVHLALAQHYARMKAEQNGEDIEDWCEPVRAVRLIAKKEKTGAFADLAIDAYHRHTDQYPNDIHNKRILEVESLYETTIGGKYLFTGRMDLVWEDQAGRVVVEDHKTTGRLTNRHSEFYAVSGQLIGYRHLAKAKWGDRFGGLRLNLIQHGGDMMFMRMELPRSPNLEARFERIVIDIEESIDRVKTEGRDLDGWPKAMNELTCYHRYGPCKFLARCRMGKGAKESGNWSWEG